MFIARAADCEFRLDADPAEVEVNPPSAGNCAVWRDGTPAGLAVQVAICGGVRKKRGLRHPASESVHVCHSRMSESLWSCRQQSTTYRLREGLLLRPK